MTTVIKGGTIVTADLTYESDVKIEDGIIIEIGPNLSGDDVLDATGCYVMPAASIRMSTSKCPSWAPIRATISKPAPVPLLPVARRWLSTSVCPIRARACLMR